MVCNVLSKLNITGGVTAIAEQTKDIYENDLIKLTDDSISGRLILGLKVMVVGVGLVFGVLFSLFLVLQLFNLMYKLRLKKTVPTETESFPELQPVMESVAEIISDKDNSESELDGEIIAVIAAAIAAYTDKPMSEFKVVNFKRVNYK